VISSSQGVPVGATRVPLDALADGLDSPKSGASGDLEGRVFITDVDDGAVIRHRFHDGDVTWRYLGLRAGAETRGTNPYEAFLVDDGLYFVQFQRDDRPIEATTLVLDLTNGRTISVTSIIGPPSAGLTPVAQLPRLSLLEDHLVRGTPIALSTDLDATRLRLRAGADREYEQRFVEASLIDWSWRSGPAAGTSAASRFALWRIRPGIHLVATREIASPVASVAILDHRDAEHARSVGVLFGLSGSGTSIVHVTYAAEGSLTLDALSADASAPGESQNG
jgi:hypothetical protein